MIITMILIFVFGYLCIALEHKLRIDKAAIALLMCGALWTVLSLLGNDAQIGTQLIEQLGDTSEILFFLIGAMTIVELIDRVLENPDSEENIAAVRRDVNALMADYPLFAW